jgi:hypothetical protein
MPLFFPGHKANFSTESRVYIKNSSENAGFLSRRYEYLTAYESSGCVGKRSPPGGHLRSVPDLSHRRLTSPLYSIASLLGFSLRKLSSRFMKHGKKRGRTKLSHEIQISVCETRLSLRISRQTRTATWCRRGLGRMRAYRLGCTFHSSGRA